MVEVQNSTPEPDGSYRTYFLRVPNHTFTARDGVAWTFGLSGAGVRAGEGDVGVAASSPPPVQLASLLPGQEGAVVGDVSGARGTVAIEVAVADGDGGWVEHDVLVGGLDVSAIKTAQRGVPGGTTTPFRIRGSGGVPARAAR